MTFTVEQKSQLAKLLATENIRIEHQKIRTAMFDVKGRVLYLPIWKNMTGSLYDLLVGHEVGHALYTPSDGWHGAISDESKPKSFKNFLNVVEDARIEKKIQRRYPGLRGSFKTAYQSLMDQDFFKLKNRDINTLSFIDRLNLFTKSQYSMVIEFSETELGLVEDVKNVETWEDVVDAANRIFEYSKKEQQEILEEEFGASKDTSSDEYDDGEESDEFDDDGEESDAWDSDESDEEYDDWETSDSVSNGSGENDEFEDYDKDFEPVCETDEAHRENENYLVDDASKDYLYLNIPELDVDKMITPVSVVHKQISEYYQNQIDVGYISDETINQMVNDFKMRNERYVSLLVKEFEMNKAAKAYSKNRVAETGEIDINRLSSYKFDDNIFRKVTIVPKGKSHGLILLLDCSGSMNDNMAGSIEQILILSMFCRKVNIPFRVFGFNDSINVYICDQLASGKAVDKIDSVFRNRPPATHCGYSHKNKDFGIEFCNLREYLNSTLSAADYTKSFRNMVILYNSYLYKYPGLGRPESEYLSNTPLISAIVGCQKIILDFKKKNNLDLTNLIIVHDGDADSRMCFYNQDLILESYNSYRSNVYLCDKKNKYQKKLDYKMKNRFDPFLEGILEWFSATTKSKIFGFFLVENANYRINNTLSNKYFKESDKEHYIPIVEQDELRKQLKSNKFLRSYTPGYSSFFFVVGGSELQIQNDELEISGQMTQAKLKNAFMKMNKKKQVSRVFVNQFIKGIAA